MTSSPVRAPKIQRWIDLIAALLRRRYGVTFEELSREVPAYADATSREAQQRMFERDKDELRKLGVAIDVLADDDGVPSDYLLRRKDFYLPYLLATSTRADQPGYRDLPRLAFEPDELATVADAAERVRRLGDPLLEADAESAIRKLAFDLPIGALVSTAPVTVVAGRARADARSFELLHRALRRRKRASFAYRSPDHEDPEHREVEPWGLFFLGGHWYLVGRDVARSALRNFRLNRIDGVAVNGRREQSPDYEIPPDFDLHEHAMSRQAWELGDGEAMDAVVAFRVRDGAGAAAARLGEAENGDGGTRRFRVRRMPPFVRWLLSFGGDAVPVSPAAVVAGFRTCVRETLARYERDRASTRGKNR